MSFLAGKKCYLGGAIERCKAAENWRPPVIKELLSRFGLDVFDPFSDPKQQWVGDLKKAKAEHDYETIHRITKAFVRKDLQIVQKAEVHVAFLPRDVPTTGTVHEIVVSNQCKNPILLVCPEGKIEIPLWYWGYIPHKHMFGSWEELYAFLAEVNEGKHKDEFLWSYIYGLV
jgi:hypothetical protein